MFRPGRISSVNAEKHRVKVRFEDGDGYESAEFPVLVARPGDYCLPPKDSLVVCALEGGPEGIGYVLGCFYSDADTPPLSDANQRSIKSDDLRLGNPEATIPVALADYVDDRLSSVQSTFDSHIHTTTATIGPSAVVGIISPPTSPIGALDSTAADLVTAE